MVSNFVHIGAKYKNNGRHVEYYRQKIWEISESIFDNFLYMHVSKPHYITRSSDLCTRQSDFIIQQLMHDYKPTKQGPYT